MLFVVSLVAAAAGAYVLNVPYCGQVLLAKHEVKRRKKSQPKFGRIDWDFELDQVGRGVSTRFLATK